MSVHSPRRRLVNFRVNDEEYESLRAACATHGARSVSDFARLAVLGRARVGRRQAASVQRQLSDLGLGMSELESRLGQLLRALDGAGANGSGKLPEEAGAGR